MNDEPKDGATHSNPDDETERPDSDGGVCQPSVSRTAELAADGESPGESTDAESSDDGVLARLKRIQEEGGVDLRSSGRQAEQVMEAFEPEERLETKLRWEGPGKLVYEPTLYQTGPEQFAIEAKRERRGLIPWGFWGGLLFVGVALILIAGAQDIYTSWDFLLALLGLSAGALMYRYGRKSTLDETLLCELDGRRRSIHWPEGAQSGLDETYLSFDDITEVVFGMTKLPVDENVTGVRVDAFALLVRTTDDELIPVVEGSPYKGNVHEIAKFVAEATETELTYVGRGID